MQTDDRMTTNEAIAQKKGWTLIEWEPAYIAACEDVLEQLVSEHPDADDAKRDEMEKTVNDAVTNAWKEGLSHEDWCNKVLRRLR
jgi:hypothetical protein